jgi:hypothetical protein
LASFRLIVSYSLALPLPLLLGLKFAVIFTLNAFDSHSIPALNATFSIWHNEGN